MSGWSGCPGHWTGHIVTSREPDVAIELSFTRILTIEQSRGRRHGAMATVTRLRPRARYEPAQPGHAVVSIALPTNTRAAELYRVQRAAVVSRFHSLWCLFLLFAFSWLARPPVSPPPPFRPSISPCERASRTSSLLPTSPILPAEGRQGPASPSHAFAARDLRGCCLT